MEQYRQPLNWLQQQQANMTKTLIEWANINSGTYHLDGLAKMSQVLQKAFSELSTDIAEIELLPFSHVNSLGQVVQCHVGKALSIRKRPEAPQQVFLCGHMDTVYGADHPFQQVKKIDDNTLNGPGVTDMKGGLLIVLYALHALEQSPFADQLGWEVLITSDEEIGSPASAALLAEVGKRHKVAFIFEPALSSGDLVGARKGCAVFTVVAKGRAAHAGRDFQAGRNAICHLAEFIQSANHLNGKREGVTINVGRIHGGSATNVVPNLAIAEIDVRITQSEDEAWVKEAFNKIVSELSDREGFQIELHGDFHRKPKPLDAKNLKLLEFVVAAAKELNLNIQWHPSGGCCDGNNLSAAGVAVVDSLGVRGGDIHSEKEFIKLDSLVERSQLAALLLMKLAKEQNL
ncbi:MAG: hydrolase [Proteobacteria bacterium]|nr:hydrolase [Pseudomonadota bacterium]